MEQVVLLVQAAVIGLILAPLADVLSSHFLGREITSLRPGRQNLLPLVGWISPSTGSSKPDVRRRLYTEIAALLLFPTVAFVLGSVVPMLVIPLAFVWLIMMSTEMQDHILPDPLTYGSALVVAAALLISPSDDYLGTAIRVVSGAAIWAGWPIALMLIKPGAMGMGDVKLGLSIGALMGYVGWTSSLTGLWIMTAVAPVALVVLATRARFFQHKHLEFIPFGPVLIISTLAAVQFGEQVWNGVNV